VIEDMFRLGREMSLASGFQFNGFLRPLSFEKSAALGFREAAGEKGGLYRLIAPAELLSEDDLGVSLFCRGDEYELLRVEVKYIGNTATHAEYLLRRV